jgi:hypothetical protein
MAPSAGRREADRMGAVARYGQRNNGGQAFDVVELREDQSAEGLVRGQVGTVVEAPARSGKSEVFTLQVPPEVI